MLAALLWVHSNLDRPKASFPCPRLQTLFWRCSGSGHVQYMASSQGASIFSGHSPPNAWWLTLIFCMSAFKIFYVSSQIIFLFNISHSKPYKTKRYYKYDLGPPVNQTNPFSPNPPYLSSPPPPTHHIFLSLLSLLRRYCSINRCHSGKIQVITAAQSRSLLSSTPSHPQHSSTLAT